MFFVERRINVDYYSFVLFCSVLFCFVLFCFVLFVFFLFCSVFSLYMYIFDNRARKQFVQFLNLNLLISCIPNFQLVSTFSICSKFCVDNWRL